MATIKASSSKQTHPQKQLDNFHLFKTQVIKVLQKEKKITILSSLGEIFVRAVRKQEKKKHTDGSTKVKYPQ